MPWPAWHGYRHRGSSTGVALGAGQTTPSIHHHGWLCRRGLRQHHRSRLSQCGHRRWLPKQDRSQFAAILHRGRIWQQRRGPALRVRRSAGALTTTPTAIGRRWAAASTTTPPTRLRRWPAAPTTPRRPDATVSGALTTTPTAIGDGGRRRQKHRRREYSFAAGFFAEATNDGSFVWQTGKAFPSIPPTTIPSTSVPLAASPL